MKLTEERLNEVLKESLDNIYVILADESIDVFKTSLSLSSVSFIQKVKQGKINPF